jgi:hypothetical protein
VVAYLLATVAIGLWTALAGAFIPLAAGLLAVLLGMVAGSLLLPQWKAAARSAP